MIDSGNFNLVLTDVLQVGVVVIVIRQIVLLIVVCGWRTVIFAPILMDGDGS